jgi:cytidylate kinase
MAEANLFLLPSLVSNQGPALTWLTPDLVVGVTGYYPGTGATTVASLVAEALSTPCIQDAGQPQRRQAVQWWQETHPGDPLPDLYSETVIDGYEAYLHEPGNDALLRQVNIETDRGILKTAASGDCVISGKASVALLNTPIFVEACGGSPPPVLTTLLGCELQEAANRALGRDLEREIISTEALEADRQQLLLQKMEQLEQRREQYMGDWRTIWGLDVDHLGQYYNLTVDTSNITPQQVTAIILQSLGL